MQLHLGKLILIGFVYATIPLIVKAITQDESYNFKENWIIFAIQWISMFSYKLFNSLLIVFVIVILEMKLEFKKQAIAMINPRFKFTHKVTPILP